ncbi:mediator of RNA polymerase II transcription subunit 21-like isoform X1 [Eriocheir sinensis]|uniref:mediator of RNA polymerase II transcription subunit 21-like isoform X1 n=1 Tax=Eriocheir sinensis TaxID=95602 RepID=UPI0021CA9101|nr:mediator of RNA polymerase II transcription subunit 21-like isoform X1 [Eriocheir sinensis]
MQSKLLCDRNPQTPTSTTFSPRPCGHCPSGCTSEAGRTAHDARVFAAHNAGEQAENLFNSIGCLFNSAAPCSFDKSGKTPSQNENPDDMVDHKRVFATIIARNAKDIDALIESLPSEDSSAELQTASMRVLEQEGEEAAQMLQRGIDRGDKLLEEINRALTEIANTQLAINRITEASQGDAIKI